MELERVVAEAIDRGAKLLFSAQRVESFWCAEIEANLSILSDYVALQQVLNLEWEAEEKERIVRFYTERQNQNGSWCDADWKERSAVSSTAEAYVMLRILGVSPTSTLLRKARKFIVRRGGLTNVPILTRIKCAMFGLVPWDAIPTAPAELVLLPSNLPLNLHTSSDWRRSVLIPLLIIYHHRPVFALPNRTAHNADACLPNGARKCSGYDNPFPKLSSLKVLRKLHGGIDFKSLLLVARNFLVRVYENHKFGCLREHARKKCIDWIVQKDETKSKCSSSSGETSSALLLHSAVALSLEGYSIDSGQIQERFSALYGRFWPWENNNNSTGRFRSCTLSIWNTALASLSLLDCGWDPEDKRLEGAILWLLDRRLQLKDGDWRAAHTQRLSSATGSIGASTSEQCCKKRYPDVNVTAAVLITLLHHKKSYARTSIHIERAIWWCLRLQNSDGGWSASDAEKSGSKSQHDDDTHQLVPGRQRSHSGPSTPDITGHIMEALGLYLKSQVSKQHTKSLRKQAYMACQRGSLFLQATQDSQGAWLGRWGVNDMYSTMKALCGLANVGARKSKRVVFRATNWLRHCHNGDGGWGEHGKSTPSRTAWALVGLMTYLPAEDDVIERGVRWLVENQNARAEAPRYNHEVDFVPSPIGSNRCGWYVSHLHNDSHLSRRCFPMIALGRFLRLRSSSAMNCPPYELDCTKFNLASSCGGCHAGER